MNELFQTVSDLAKAGYAGVGVIVFLLLFILLLRGKPVDAASARLYNRFLTWGVSFAAFSGILSIVALFAAPNAAARQAKLLVNLSPQFETRKLTPPAITLDGMPIKPNQSYPWEGGTIFVTVDQALADVDNIKQTVQQYGTNINALREQRDALAVSVSGPAADADIKAASEKAAALQGEVKKAIEIGDFSRAAAASKQLNAPQVLSPAAIRRLAQRVPPR
jgi:hypothetical protein